MNKEYYEHGDLYWVNLRPFFDKYLLIKIIDYAYFGPASQNSKYVYVYDCFVNSIIDTIPLKKERVLYMDPFNFREFYIIGTESMHYIKPEQVETFELKYSYSIYKRLVVSDEVSIVNTANGFSSYSLEFPYEDLYMFDIDSLYSEHQIQTRIIHELFKNEEKEYKKVNTPSDSNLESTKVLMNPNEIYSNFLEKTNEKYINRPSFKDLVTSNKNIFISDWDKEYPSYDPESKIFTVLNSWSSDYEYGFINSLIPEYKLLKPHFEKLGVHVSGGSVVALIASIVYSDNNYLNQIDYANFKVIQMHADSFAMVFGSESENIAVMDFYKNEILNPKRIEYFMSLMNVTLLELYYTTDVPIRFGKLIRYDIEDRFLDIISLFKMAKDEIDYFGVTINIKDLRKHFGFDLSLDTFDTVTSMTLEKKYKLLDYHKINSEYHVDVYMTNSLTAKKYYKFLKRSFKNVESFNKMKLSLKLE